MTNALRRFPEFLRMDSTPGVILIISAALALMMTNFGLEDFYKNLFSPVVEIRWGEYGIEKPLLLWINDGLMAVFFLLVGLEIKRELMQGALSSVQKASFPIVAAIGGMVGPILIFMAFNQPGTATFDGWAIPAATDIAFALGILILMGPRIPVALKILLLAVAIIDDLGAISIIAIFYTEDLSVTLLGLSAACFGLLMLMNTLGIYRLWPYLTIGVIMWTLVLHSGVHATLAGVMLAMAIPLKRRSPDERSLLHNLEHGIQPFVAFLVLPVFAFANSGVNFVNADLSAFASPLTLGIAAGLFFGKQIGVFFLTRAVAAMGLIHKPEGTTWAQVYGVAVLTGIGFTMSLFIGGLSFNDPALMDQVRMGVLAGSTASAILGIAILLRACPAPQIQDRAPAAKATA